MPRDLGLDDVVSQYPEAAQELAELHEANAALQRELDEAKQFGVHCYADLAAATKYVDALREFAQWALNNGPFDGNDLDGGDVQDKAVELGLLTETVYDPSTHGPSDYAEPGDPFYVFSAVLNEQKP